eukprot:scaffold154110_cov28-Tisochrysis_lutea.AAC.2
MRDAERLVQVEVAHISPEVAGPAEADLCVHVGAVHVDLAAVIMDGVADFDDGLLEDAVSGGVGHVDVALGVAANGHDAHAAHGGRGGVGAVRRDRDEADIAVALANGLLVGPDGTQPRVLAGGPRVGLERHTREASDLAEHLLERVDHRLVAHGLLGWRERVDAVYLRPRDRDHFGGGLEDIAQQLVLRLVLREYRVRHELGGTCERVGQRWHLGGEQVVSAEGRSRAAVEGTPCGLEVGETGRLVGGKRDCRVVELAEVDALLYAGGEHLVDRLAGRRRDAHRVEEGRVGRGAAELEEAGAQHSGRLVAVGRDVLESLWAVVHAVERSNVGEKSLRRANVRRGLVAPDVLLACLHGHAVGGLALSIDGEANDAAGHLARERLRGGKEAGVRPAEAKRHAKALR